MSCQKNECENLTKFGSGAVRSGDLVGLRYDLLSPIGMRREAAAAGEGAIKYSPFNWEKGMPVHDLLCHVIAHCYKYLAGDRSEDHLGHAKWGCGAACHSEELWPELNAGTLRGPNCAAPCDPPRVDKTRAPIAKSCTARVKNQQKVHRRTTRKGK